MERKRLVVIASIATVLLLYGGYAAAVTSSNGSPTKHVAIVAGVGDNGLMYFRCEIEGTTHGLCENVDGDHARITVDKRDRVQVMVRTDDGRAHSHDFRLEGAAYLMWPAGIEMELDDGPESATFTAWATGEYRFVCELNGHEAAGMWGTLIVR